MADAAAKLGPNGRAERHRARPGHPAAGISLANLGGDFIALGNEAVTSTGRARAFGGELFFQQQLTRNLYAVASYTLFQSENSDEAVRLLLRLIVERLVSAPSDDFVQR